jgi:hypothetical protein
MDNELVDQLEDVLESLRMAESKAKRAVQTMRQKRIFFGLDYNYLDEDIVRLIGMVQYAKRRAENLASRLTADGHDRSPEQDVDGRIVSVSDAGDALVVNPVQDATAISGISPEGVEGMVVAGDESVAGATTEGVGIPPAVSQPPTGDDAPAVEQAAPEEADGT